MKKIATKLITISSQILIVSLFLVVFFSNVDTNDRSITVDNNNFSKMADSVSFLFKKEEMMLDIKDDNIVVELSNEKEEVSKENNVYEEETPLLEEQEEKEDNSVVSLEPDVLETYTGSLTGYGPDCYGCSGRTSSGHNLNETVYYQDSEYGSVRILAADPYFQFYSIIRVSNVPGMEPFLAIVLDTGGNVGFNRGTLFDLAYATEKDPNIIGLTNNVTFEVLRRGK